MTIRAAQKDSIDVRVTDIEQITLEELLDGPNAEALCKEIGVKDIDTFRNLVRSGQLGDIGRKVPVLISVEPVQTD